MLACTSVPSTGDHYHEFSKEAAKAKDCNLAVYLPGQPVLVKAHRIGRYVTQEPGEFGDRRWDVVLTRNKLLACSKGADAVQFESIETPTSMRPYYSSSAKFLKYDQ